MKSDKNYLNIVKHYERCFDKYGDTSKGVDWPIKADANKRYAVMMELILKDDLKEGVTIIDLGCGTAHLYEYISQAPEFKKVIYTGIDISDKYIQACKGKYPNSKFLKIDILESGFPKVKTDYVIMNGVFTEKRELSYEEMWKYFKNMIKLVYESVRVGIAFNLMSKHVDWEREDLFHVPFDQLAQFLTREVSRDFVFRNDYGLYEYTTYLYK